MPIVSAFESKYQARTRGVPLWFHVQDSEGPSRVCPGACILISSQSIKRELSSNGCCELSSPLNTKQSSCELGKQ